MPTFHTHLTHFYHFLFNLRTRPAPADFAFKSTVILSPHPDDETLGCGGIIQIKKKHQTPLKIIFLSDGSNSHPNFYPANTLTALRMEETIRACAQLGVPEEDLVFLNYPDSNIKSYQKEIFEKILPLLDEIHPEEIYIPHRLEETADHYFTYKIAQKVLREISYPVRIYEYLIWSWMQWPFISKKYLNKSKEKFVKNLIRKAFGLRLLVSTNTKVNIINHLTSKQKTVDFYLTQTQPISTESHYPTLKNYCEGQFLKACLQPYEYFRIWKNHA